MSGILTPSFFLFLSRFGSYLCLPPPFMIMVKNIYLKNKIQYNIEAEPERLFLFVILKRCFS